MTLITDSITFNVRERGRKYRGVDRNFDTARLATLINSPAVQEKVKHGDMLGYLGHWPRVKFGMEVCEGGIDQSTGKAVSLPVAVRTTELAAQPDGTITHRAEFLDTEAGEIAAGLYRSKAGGFSSAIDAVPRTSPAIPRGFYGFDFVYEPNFTKNRGHVVTLDSASVSEDLRLAMLLDSALAHAGVEQEEMLAIFDGLHAQHVDALAALERMANERDELLDRLAAAKGMDKQAVLDSVFLEDARLAPARVLSADISKWTNLRGAPLAALSALPTPAAAPSPEGDYANRRFGFKG